jgi:predicted Zn-dependent protease
MGVPALSQTLPVAQSPNISVAATPASLLQQGQELYQQRQYGRAIATWQTALNDSTINEAQQAAIWAYLALAYQKTGQWQEGEGAIANNLGGYR